MIVVAECGLTHDGSLGTAYSYIDAVARAGASAVKFQCHAGNTCQRFREGTFFPQDSDRQGYYERTAFTYLQWRGLADYARSSGLSFALSAWSVDTVGALDRFVDIWKLGASETNNLPLVEACARTGKPLVLSSGMSDWDELGEAVSTAWRHTRDITILQCTSAYPCPPERVGMNCIEDIRERFCIPFWGRKRGLSDHSGTIWPGIVAAWLGADMLEVHVCLSRECFGPDVPASITTGELRQLVDGVAFVERMRANPVDKDAAAREAVGMRQLFRGGRDG